MFVKSVCDCIVRPTLLLNESSWAIFAFFTVYVDLVVDVEVTGVVVVVVWVVVVVVGVVVDEATVVGVW